MEIHPALTNRIDSKCDVNDVIFIATGDVMVAAFKDRKLRIYQLRQDRKYWESVIETLASPAYCLLYDSENSRLFTGLENGTVTVFSLQDDFNAMSSYHDYLSHMDRITGLALAFDLNLIISISKDKTVALYSTDKNSSCESVFQLESPGTCLSYDAVGHCVFAGESSGAITLLSLVCVSNRVTCQVLAVLRRHTDVVTCLALDNSNSRLYSSSKDCSVISWDVGPDKKIYQELQAHSSEATSVCWWAAGVSPLKGSSPGLLVSAGSDGLVVFWFTTDLRQLPPTWSSANQCGVCNSPFFWNISAMAKNKSATFNRQHHCRQCGKATCDKCSHLFSTLPAIGFEKQVRVCKVCFSDTEYRSLALLFPTSEPIQRVKVNEKRKIMVTIGKDRAIKVWNVASLG